MLLQAKHALATVVASIAWGTPWALWWELYDNTRVFTLDGKDLADLGIYEDRGFGLVSHENKDSVLYQAVKQYIREANQWLCKQFQVGHWAAGGCFWLGVQLQGKAPEGCRHVAPFATSSCGHVAQHPRAQHLQGPVWFEHP